MTEITAPAADQATGALPGPLTHSELKTYRTCQRRWWLTYRRHLDEPESARAATGVAQLGTNVHLALQGHYEGVDALDVVAEIYEDTTSRYPDQAHEIALERGYAMAMVKGYLDWVAETGLDAAWSVVGAEVDISIPLTLLDGREVALRGKLDQIVERRDGTGTRAVRDFKTVAAFDKADALVRDSQMRTYDYLHFSYENRYSGAHPTDGVLYTMIKRSKRTAAAKPPFFEVVHQSYNLHDKRSAHSAITGTAAQILRTDADLEAGLPHHYVVPANPTDACAWSCPFVSVCHLADDGSRFEDALADNFVTADPWDHYGTARMDAIRAALGGRVGRAENAVEGNASV